MNAIKNILPYYQFLLRALLLFSFSILSIGLLTSQCLTSYPNAESFETDFGIWNQSSSDDFDWTMHAEATPTNGTGPVYAMNGTYYIYTEATANSNLASSIETCVDLSLYCAAEIEFNYHMLGSDVGSLALEVSDDSGVSWNLLWSESGDQDVSWYVKIVDLSDFDGDLIQLKFTANNLGDLGDIALDNIRIRALEEPEVTSVTQIDPKCEEDNGSITFNYIDKPQVDSLQFSLDGGVSWSVAVADNSSAFTIINLAPGTYDLWVRNNDSDDCSTDLSDLTLTNQPSPIVNFSLSESEICEDASPFALVSGIPTGGDYSGDGVDDGIFSPILAGGGTHTITYTYIDGNGCDGSASDDIEVFGLPAISFNLPSAVVCSDETNLLLTGGSPSGGSYSAEGVSGGYFDASAVAVGTHTITYTYEDNNECIQTVTDELSVIEIPTTTLNLPTLFYCVNEADVSLTGGAPADGEYTGAGINSNVLSLSTAGVGEHVITYTYTNAEGCEDSAAQSITIYDAPSTAFTLTDTEGCVTETIHALDIGTPLGGIYSGPGVTGANFNASDAGIGVHTISYTYTDSNGCIGVSTDEIDVLNLPAPYLNLDINEACLVSASIDLTGGSPAGGSWSGPGVSGSTFDPSIAGVGSHTLTYSFSSGSCYAEATDIFVVHALPSPTLSLSVTELCIGEILDLDGETPIGGAWSGSGVSGNKFRSSIAGIGTHMITYTYIDENGCSSEASDQITVYEKPTVSLSLAQNEICENSFLVLSGGSPLDGSYSGNGVTGTNFDASDAGNGTHLISYTYIDNNGCENIATETITVFEVPVVTFNLITDQACIDGALVELNTARPLGGTWSGPGVTGNQIDPSAAGIGTHLITYTYMINGCSDSATEEFVVSALPLVTLSLPEENLCLGEEIILSGGLPLGGTYSGPGVNSNEGVLSTVAAGLGSHTITYEYSDSDGCMASTTQEITINDIPSANLSLTTNMACASETSIVLSGGTPAGGSYSGPGVSGNIMDATHSEAGLGTHIISYIYTDTNGCEAVAIDELTIYSSPNANVTTVDEHCGQNDGSISFTYTDSPDIIWIEFSIDGGANWQSAVRDNSGGVAYNYLSAGSYDLMVRNANGSCEHSLGTVVIESIDGPIANAGSDVSITPPSTITLAGSGGDYYQWTPSEGLSNSTIANSVASPEFTTTYTLEVTDLNGCKNTDQVTVTVIPPCAGIIADGDFPHRENFESGLGLWTQESIVDDFDWARFTNNTPTSDTGPSSAYDGVWYLYAESDGHASETAIFKSPCFDLSNQSCAQFSFDYHMHGSSMGSLKVEASIDYGQTWMNIWNETGDHGDTWSRGVLELYGYVGKYLQLRFVADIGNDITSDIAIDNVAFITTGCGCDNTSSPFENFNLVPDPQPFSVDIDCDGDADMLAGGDGELFFFENNGDDTYTDKTGTAEDFMPDMTHLDMTIGLCDLDGDGDYDMSLVGNEAFNKRFYWNTGTKTDPKFTLAGDDGTPPSPIQGFDLSLLDGGDEIGHADPTIFWVDLDNDNDYDAVIGGKLGWFLYYENIGDELNPSFIIRTGSENPFDGLRVEGAAEENDIIQYESSPFLIDWDGDGDYDMFSGNQISTVQYFENIGTANDPNFVEVLSDANPLAGVIFSEDSHLCIIDEDCDGDWDIFYGVGDTPEDAEITSCDLLVSVPNDAFASADQSHYCNGSTAYLAENSTSGVAWEWEGPNEFASTDRNPVLPNLTEVAAGTYYVTVTNAQGCPHEDEVSITVSNNFAEAGIEACIEQGQSIPLSASGNGISFNWSPSAGLSSTNILSPIAAPLVTTTYLLTVTDYYGCVATDEVTIIVKSDICIDEVDIFNADFEDTTGDNLWTINTSASDGDFVIDEPSPYYYAGNLMELNAHTGSQSLITGGNSSQDLDGGPTTARSRNIILSPSATQVDLAFYWYLAHASNGDIFDFLNIELRDASNGATLITLVSEIGGFFNRPAEWTFHNEDLSAHAGKTVFIWIEAADNFIGSKMEVGIDDISITEISETTATFTMSEVDFCEENALVTLSGGMPEGGMYSGPGVVENTFNPSVAGPGAHPIVYQYTSTTGCTATTATTVQVIELPLVELSLAVPEACDTETSVTLFGGLPTGWTYSGTGVDGGIMNPSEAGAGTHVITYTVTDANGCVNSATADFVVYSTPVVTSVTAVNATCGSNNGSLIIDFNDVPGITNLEFSIDNAISWESPVPDADGTISYTDLPTGTYTVWVRNADTSCELAIEEATIIDESGPQVDAGEDQTLCDGESTVNTAIALGGKAPLIYAWTGPNNFSASELTITMAEQGIYIITVTDDNGCTAVDEVYLKYRDIEPGQISDPEIACPVNDPDLIEGIEPAISCNRVDNHQFDNDTSGNWYLDQNSGADATLITDTNNELSGPNSAFININSTTGTDWHIMLVQDLGPIFKNESYNFTFEAMAESSKTIFVELQEAQAPFTSLGIQEFTIGTTASTYTWSGLSPNIDLNEVKIQFRIGGTSDNIWIDNTVFQPSSCINSIVAYKWECRTADGAGGWLDWTEISAATSSSYDPPVQMTDKQFRRLASVQGCDEYESSNIVTVELCPCTITISGDETICPGESVALLASGTGVGALSYVWSPAAGLDDASSAFPIATPTMTTTYTVTMTDANGCAITDEVTVTVTPAIIADAGEDQAICLGAEVELSATGGTLVYWSPSVGLSNPNIANPTASPTVTTTYTVTIIDENNCPATDEVTITVFDELDASAVALSHDFCEDGTGQATVAVTAGNGPFTIDWQSTLGTESGSATIPNLGEYIITDLTGGTTYCIEVTDVNGCKILNP